MEKKEVKRYIFIAVLAVVSCYMIQNFNGLLKLIGIAATALTPLVLGAIIAYIFNIILIWFEKHYFPKKKTGFINYSRRPICLVLSFVIAIAVIVLVSNIIIPELIKAIKLMTSEIPPLLNDGKAYILLKFSEFPELQKQINEILNQFDVSTLDWASITSKVTDVVQNGIMGIISSAVGILGAVAGTVTAVAGTVTNIVLAIIFAIYLLLRKDKLLLDIRRTQDILFDKKLNYNVNHFLETANQTFQNFFVGQFVEAIILGSLCFIGMSILKLPYAGMSGTLVGVTALIPIVGAFLGAGISAFIIFTESPMQALVFLIFLVILQQLEGNIIYPKVVGNTIGLPGIWVLAAVTVGGGLFGIPGMLVGVPLAATCYKLWFEHLETKEAALGIAPPEKDEPPQKTKIKTKKEHISAKSLKKKTNKKRK